MNFFLFYFLPLAVMLCGVSVVSRGTGICPTTSNKKKLGCVNNLVGIALYPYWHGTYRHSSAGR